MLKNSLAQTAINRGDERTDALRETMTDLLKLDEAAAVGFKGIVVPEGHEVRVIAVAARDARWIHRALEANPGVTSYKVSEIE